MSERCPFCGQPELAELLEIWGPRDFMLETCCEGMHEACSEFLRENPREAGKWLGEGLGANALGLGKVRRVIDDGVGLSIDWNLTLKPVSFRDAKEFVDAHHRHCPGPRGWRYGAAIRNGSELVGVIMVGRPVARMIDGNTTVEVNRLCVRDDLNPDLVWNACSQAYGWAAREAESRGFSKIITYTMDEELGVTLRAAGWRVDGRTRGRQWSSPGRQRAHLASTPDKLRWARDLKPRARPPQ